MSKATTLIVYPASLHGGRWAAGPRVKPELVSMYTVLRRHDVPVEVLDLENEVGNPGASDRDAFLANAEAQLIARTAGLVVLSCSSSLQYTASNAVADIVRRLHPGTAIAVTGFHVSARPEDFTYEGAPYDWVILGEPEMALVEAAETVGASGKRAAVRQRCEGAGFIHSADNAPDYAAYPYTTSGLPSLPVYLSRGCPYPLAACQLRPGGQGWHAYDPDVAARLITEMDALVPGRIDVLDPVFGLDGGWRSALLDRLVRDDERRQVTVAVTVRPEALTRADLDKIYLAHVRLQFDVDTLSTELLARTEKAEYPLQYVEKALDLLRYANAKGIPGDVRFVFNQPGETRQTAGETLDRIEEFVESVPNSALRLTASSWAYAPYGDIAADIEIPRERYGTRIMHPEWWREGIPSERVAKAVVASRELADLEPGDGTYWRPRFDALAERLAAKLTREARRGLRSHEWEGSLATGVPHGFWIEPRWH